MSIGGASGSSQTQLDPDLKARWENLYGQAVNTAGQPTPQQGVAGFTPTQAQGQAMTINAANQGFPALGQAINTATNQAQGVGGETVTGAVATPISSQSTPDSAVMGYRDINPATMTAAQVGNTPDAQAWLTGNLPQVEAQTLPGTDLSSYLNPYTQDVFNTSLGDLDLARRQAINGNSATATQQGGEGAWNGARAGVSDALTNTAFAKQASDLAAGLHAQGFDTAAGLQQSDAARALAAAQSNQGTQLAAGTTNAQLGTNTSQFNAGANLTKAIQQAQLVQQAGSQNQAASMTAQGQNLNAQLTRDQAIYGGDLATNAANQQAFNAAAENNAQREQQARLANQSEYENELNRTLTGAQLLGQLGPTQQNMALTGAQAVTGVGAAQQAQAQNLLNTQYNNQQTSRNEPLQTLESAFGILPKTDSGSMTQSSGKSAGIGG